MASDFNAIENTIPATAQRTRPAMAPAWNARTLTRLGANIRSGGYAGRVLRRLSASPWTRAGLLAIALGFACYGLISQWPQVRAALGQLAAADVIGAALAVIPALGCMMLAWRA